MNLEQRFIQTVSVVSLRQRGALSQQTQLKTYIQTEQIGLDFKKNIIIINLIPKLIIISNMSSSDAEAPPTY